LDEQREGMKGGRAKHRPSHYFANNFYITTSGHFHTKPFLEAIEQIGADRVLFSVDYPYEQMVWVPAGSTTCALQTPSRRRWDDAMPIDSSG
jgi:predicted TIM-barrel fold metal-dependent hydrolase